MSETFGNGGASGGSGGGPSGDDEVREEVRLDLDEEKLDTWEDVRDDYATDPEAEVARPALTEGDAANE
jgi:DNA-directed RNA polymerase subunit delta